MERVSQRWGTLFSYQTSGMLLIADSLMGLGMWLVLQIALGVLLGYILIRNFEALTSLVVGSVVILVGVAAVAAIWYLGAQLIEAVNDYANASDLAKKMFAAIGLATFMALGLSTLVGLWFFVMISIPDSLLKFINKSEDSNVLLNISSVLLTLTILYFSADITLPGALGDFHNSWTAWGLEHGMGYDGGDFFGLLLWQFMWPLNFVILWIQRRSFASAIRSLKRTAF